MSFAFAKYHRGGNDFILIDDRALRFPVDKTEDIAALCHRSKGIGADGILLWQPSAKADCRLRIFNADGSEPAMCGNGILCFIDFMRQQGRAKTPCSIETAYGLLTGHFDEKLTGIELGCPSTLTTYPAFLHDQALHVLDTGVPHGVIFVDRPPTDDLLSLAPSIRFHAAFAPHGINVNFAHIVSSDRIVVRTYERGVEGETLSCGTGAAAVAWAAAHLYPEQISDRIEMAGLEVRLERKKMVALWGKATRVFHGHF